MSHNDVAQSTKRNSLEEKEIVYNSVVIEEKKVTNNTEKYFQWIQKEILD